MKKKIVSALLTATMVCGMSVVPAVGVAAADDTITVGFSQVGAESDWRTANTESMKSTFSEENGYELIFDDAQQKQENQLTAIRNRKSSVDFTDTYADASQVIIVKK